MRHRATAACLLAFALAFAAAAGAQEKEKPGPAPEKNAGPAMIGPPAGFVAGKGPNVRIEVTLTDQQTGTATVTKSVMVTTANQQWGRLRSQVESQIYGPAPLNIDARPDVLPNGRVGLQLTIEYSQGRVPSAEGNTEHIAKVSVNESLGLILEDGVPLVVTQSADPISDRKVTVGLKATVLK